MPLSLSQAEDRFGIQDTVALVAYHADARDWAALRSLFADTVRVDYTSLNGGEPADVEADTLMASWQALLPGFDGTQHLLGPIVVQLDEDEAVAQTHVRARHWLGEASWTVYGHYAYRLVRAANGSWRVSALTLGHARQEGDAGLADQARDRAASRW